MDRKFEWNGATFIVREPTVETAMDADYIASVLARGENTSRRVMNRYLQYGEFIGTVEITDGDPGFEILSVDAPDDAIVADYEAFLLLPKAFRDLWIVAKWGVLEKKEAAPASAETTPSSLTSGSDAAPAQKSA